MSWSYAIAGIVIVAIIYDFAPRIGLLFALLILLAMAANYIRWNPQGWSYTENK